jgi:hypothetical protein
MRRFALFAVLGFLGALVAACSPNTECAAGTSLIDGKCVPDSECGPGTKLENGKCVAEDQCGPGTKLEGGKCVPESTLECGPGTKLEDGKCVPESTLACGAGTEEVDGKCLEVCAAGDVRVGEVCGPPTADVNEGDEPNDIADDGGTPTKFDLPAVGGKILLGGNIDIPLVDADGYAIPDWDTFQFEGKAGTLLRISGRALGQTLAVAFALVALNDAGQVKYWRFGMNVQGYDAARQVFLPEDGTYYLRVSDVTTVETVLGASGLPFGGEDFGFLVLVENLAPPAPVELAVGAETELDLKQLPFLKATGASGDIGALSVAPKNAGGLLYPEAFALDDQGAVVATVGSVAASGGKASQLVPLFAGGVFVVDYSLTDGVDLAAKVKLTVGKASELFGEVEPNNDVAHANLGTGTMKAALYPAGDVDVFKLELADDRDYVFETATGPLGASPDTMLRLLDSAGKEVEDAVTNQADNIADPFPPFGIEGNLFSRISAKLAKGTYYVEVSASDYATTGLNLNGDYTLMSIKHLKQGESCDPAVLDTRCQAEFLCAADKKCAPGMGVLCTDPPELKLDGTPYLGATTEGAGSFFEGSCRYSERFQAPEAVLKLVVDQDYGTLTVSTNYPETTFDTVVYVIDQCDAEGKEIANGEDSACADDVSLANLASTLEIKDVKAGTYFVVVDASSATPLPPASKGGFGYFKLTATAKP